MNQVRQQGVALFLSLVLLLVLTIVGVSSVQTTSLEVRMTRNHNDRTIAFQAAESALRDAEAVLWALPTAVDFDTPDGRYTVADFKQEEHWRGDIWSGAGSIVAATDVEGAIEQPRYIIENLGPVINEENAYMLDDPYGAGGPDRIEMFRVTARGVGGTTAAQVFLQSYVGRIVD